MIKIHIISLWNDDNLQARTKTNKFFQKSFEFIAIIRGKVTKAEGVILNALQLKGKRIDNTLGL